MRIIVQNPQIPVLFHPIRPIGHPGAEKYIVEIEAEEAKQRKNRMPEPVVNKRMEPDRHDQRAYSFSEHQAPMTAADLDVPAFLRKRIRG